MDAKTRIARRVALEMTDGDVVNLGIGLPTQVVHYLPSGVEVMVQSENGFVGLGAVGQQDANLVDAGGQPAGLVPGAAMFDSAMSFALIRGGHIDVTVLGGWKWTKKEIWLTGWSQDSACPAWGALWTW